MPVSDTTPGPTTPPPGEPWSDPAPGDRSYSPRRRAALAITLLAVLMDMVDATILNVALPSVQADLDASSTQLEWSLAGYTLAFATAMITGARLGDRYGRRRVYLAGLAGFVVTSTLAGLATGPETLVAARVLQGASAALMVPQVLAMLQVEFPLAERARAMSLYGMTFAVGGIGGPLLGGVLLEADLFGLGWRPIFFINIPIGIAAFIGTLVLARESRAEHADTADLRGTLIATGGLLAVLFPLVEGRELDWPLWTFALMATAPVLLWLFIRYERRVVRRGESPIIDPALFRHRGAVGGLTVAVLFFAAQAYTLVMTLHLQAGVGFSPLRTAAALVPFTVGIGIGAVFAGRLVPLGRRVVMAGSLIMALGMAMILVAVDRSGAELEQWQLVPGMVVGGLGMAMVAQTLVTIVLAKVPTTAAGGASSLVNTSIQVGVAAGIAVVGTVYFAMLDGGEPPVDSATVGLLVVIGLLVLAAALAFVLPPDRLPADDGSEQRRGEEPDAHDDVDDGAPLGVRP
ncbi:MFS transporter [Jiangella asiatica]|uniref:MFS transporter n=1 Tax=Jiangella asiatica TaxID=2530372 RepID=A0A4R5DAG7_9ACTN|nr:MFS transporter [Jiangella asiatica]TDE08434.1 MFS transporter [Jiangella asiatica]